MEDILLFVLYFFKLSATVAAAVIAFCVLKEDNEVSSKLNYLARSVLTLAFLMFFIMGLWEVFGLKYSIGLKLIKYGSLAYILNYSWYAYLFILRKK